MTDSSVSKLLSDGKDPNALRTIGEVAAAFDIRQHVLRYWEQQFPMLRPLKRSGGRRYYRPEDVELVHTIARLVNQEGYTLKGARLAIENGASAANREQGSESATIAATHSERPVEDAQSAALPADLLPRLVALRDRLTTALQ